MTPLIEGPVTGVQADCERVLRTLPRWFGIESSLLEYARATERLPTFVAREAATAPVVGFLSLERHFPESWEVNCIGVDAAWRQRGIGRLLHERAEAWLETQGAATLQVKTLAESHPSPEYAETRAFYERVGYLPLEVFPTLWAPHLPVLQLVKLIGRVDR